MYDIEKHSAVSLENAAGFVRRDVYMDGPGNKMAALGYVYTLGKNDIAVSFLFFLGGASFSPSIGLLAEIMCCTISRRMSCACDCSVGVQQVRWL